VNRFAGKDSHQIFLEPERADIGRIYVNGFSSSLPESVQVQALHTIPGLERAKVLQIGYAVEYDAIDATQLHPTFECKSRPGLYFAGQVCGSSGYEEAAAQGILAGANAALSALGKEPFLLSRADSYIGVLANDLTSLQIEEPYRMFTSRAEYRLFLRQDNAAERLTPKARNAGLVPDAQWERFQQSQERIAEARKILQKSLPQMKRPDFDPDAFFAAQNLPLTRREMWHIYAEEHYKGFMDRQMRELEHLRKMETVRIPAEFDYAKATALSFEARQKLQAASPLTLGAAGRIAGVRAGDLTVLLRILDTHTNSA
jgi:tRNA uridine 5-carboxymethylaminomethyl modification enzyme